MSDDLHGRIHEALRAAGFSDAERGRVLVLQERIDVAPPNDIECTSITELISKVKDHYKRYGGTVKTSDDPRRLTIGYSIESSSPTTPRWFIRLSKVKEARSVDAIYQDFLRTHSGRENLAKLIMSAAKSEPPPPMRSALTVQVTPVMTRIGEDALPTSGEEESIDVTIEDDDQ